MAGPGIFQGWGAFHLLAFGIVRGVLLLQPGYLWTSTGILFGVLPYMRQMSETSIYLGQQEHRSGNLVPSPDPNLNVDQE